MTFRGQAVWSLICFVVMSVPMALADVKLNEIYRDPEDPQEGREFFELISTTGGESLADVWFLEIDGDGANQGIVDQALALSAASPAATGSNGLFLWRDLPVELLPPREPATVLHVSDFDPNLEDGVVTYMLVRSFSGMAGADLDSDNNGILDATPWSEVLDAVSIKDAEDPGSVYANQVGGFDFLDIHFGADALSRMPNGGQWFAFDSSHGDGDPTYVGPFWANDETDNILQDGTIFDLPPTSTILALTPGSANMMIPEPSVVSSLVLGAVGWLRRRRHV